MIIASYTGVAAVAPPTPCRKCDIDVAIAPRAEKAGANSNLRSEHPLWGAFVRMPEAAMKLSARNILPGRVVAVTKGSTTAHVKIELAPGLMMTSSITNEAVDDLGLKVGDEAWAVIKASDVMVGK
jgi:molybdopterin-binding protein